MQFPTYQFSNCIFKAYSDAENLYLAGLEGTYAFPLASITAIQTIKKTCSNYGMAQGASLQ